MAHPTFFRIFMITVFIASFGGGKNHPHVVVTSTKRAKFGGDRALLAKFVPNLWRVWW